RLDARGGDYATRGASRAERMAPLMDDLLQLSRAARGDLQIQKVDLSGNAPEIATQPGPPQPQRPGERKGPGRAGARGEEGLLRAVLENLLENAWKFSARRECAHIDFGARTEQDGALAYFVRDDGAGFDAAYAQDLFRPFERLHKESEFPGTGVGLAIVQRIVRRHGGRVWAEGAPQKGATFYFTLGDAPPNEAAS